jgi:phosphatidylserine/phosphatidylglycerophosphate/cardiolipin synthase-like enzyme
MGVVYYHAKYAIFDHQRALIMTCNWSYSAFNGNREVIVSVDDVQTVTDLEAVFAADFAHRALVLSYTPLIVSPLNSRAKILAMLTSATREIWVGMEEVEDDESVTALIERSADGVPVKVLTTQSSATTSAARRLVAGGVEVRSLASPYVHEKVMVVDALAFVGSENLSSTSLDANREIGLVGKGAFADAMRAQLAADWENAAAAP